MKTLALYNLKGGVGKTTAAVNLAWLAASYGHRTLLWDLDPQAAATWVLGLEPGLADKPRKLVNGKRDWSESIVTSDWPLLDVLPADFRTRNLDVHLSEREAPCEMLRDQLASWEKRYDFVILDCPPSLSVLAEAVFRVADLLVLPLIPAPLSMRTYQQVVQFLAQHRAPTLTLRPFLSMVDRRRRDHREWCEELALRLPTALRTEIPYSARIETMTRKRQPLPVFAPRDNTTRQFELLWLETARVLRRPPESIVRKSGARA